MKQAKFKIFFLCVIAISSLLFRCGETLSEKQEKMTIDSNIAPDLMHSDCQDSLHYVSDFLDLCKEYLSVYYLKKSNVLEISEYAFKYNKAKGITYSEFIKAKNVPFNRKKHGSMSFILPLRLELNKDTIFACFWVGASEICLDSSKYQLILFKGAKRSEVLIIGNIRTYEIYYLYDTGEEEDYHFKKEGYTYDYSDSLEHTKSIFYYNLINDETVGYFNLKDCNWVKNFPKLEYYYCINNVSERETPLGLTVLGYEVEDLGNKYLKSFKNRFDYSFKHELGIKEDPYPYTKEQEEFFNKIHLEKRKIVEERKQKRKAKTDKIPKYFQRVRK
ncbi:MAG: hypothetical protein K1X92_19050 [Bacteroidia bacterium]|nr:hypothetical protein [Bacteroidia bacterium]